jgi:hypothetical protein
LARQEKVKVLEEQKKQKWSEKYSEENGSAGGLYSSGGRNDKEKAFSGKNNYPESTGTIVS